MAAQMVVAPVVGIVKTRAEFVGETVIVLGVILAGAASVYAMMGDRKR